MLHKMIVIGISIDAHIIFSEVNAVFFHHHFTKGRSDVFLSKNHQVSTTNNIGLESERRIFKSKDQAL